MISQRPSEVNRTVLSQCNNYIAMRLTNADDQTVIKKLLPDNLSGFTDLLSTLDVGEALVVGDASLLPTRVYMDKPRREPDRHRRLSIALFWYWMLLVGGVTKTSMNRPIMNLFVDGPALICNM